jgi:hypothetical protein
VTQECMKHWSSLAVGVAWWWWLLSGMSGGCYCSCWSAFSTTTHALPSGALGLVGHLSGDNVQLLCEWGACSVATGHIPQVWAVGWRSQVQPRQRLQRQTARGHKGGGEAADTCITRHKCETDMMQQKAVTMATPVQAVLPLCCACELYNK